MEVEPDLSRCGDPAPPARLLSNGRYTTLITGSGTGLSSWGGYALTSWDGDRTEDGDGLFVYLRDLETGVCWSAGRQPVRRLVGSYSAGYDCGRVWIERCDDGIETRIDVGVPPGDDIEIRKLRLCNRSDRPRRIEVTS